MRTCRLSGQYLPVQNFRSIACAQCLFYLYFLTPPYIQNYITKICPSGLLVCPISIEKLDFGIGENFVNCSCEESTNRIYNAAGFSSNVSTSSLEDLEKSLRPQPPKDFVLIVKECCEAAVRCCGKISRESEAVQSQHTFWDPEVYCPATWDGWQCFDDSKMGIVSAKCPNYIFGDRLRSDIDGMSSVNKECLAGGKWLTVERTGANGDIESFEWTDYGGCLANPAYKLKLIAGIAAFSLTVIAIIPAILIFSRNRFLKNKPVFIIHRQLLYSFLFSGVFYIFNCLFFAVDGAMGESLFLENHISCRLLFTLHLRFARCSTFSWMLGEGIYLYRLLMRTFETGEDSLKPYFVFCWGVPVLITVLYSALRQAYDNEDCWINPTRFWWIEWTIIGPCLSALTINIFLAFVILVVLCKNLRCNQLEGGNLQSENYRKALRGFIMLVPVFGLHFLLTIYRMPSYVHQIINLIIDGIQGFMVAVIVCYSNTNTHEAIRAWLGQKSVERETLREKKHQKLRYQQSQKIIGSPNVSHSNCQEVTL